MNALGLLIAYVVLISFMAFFDWAIGRIKKRFNGK